MKGGALQVTLRNKGLGCVLVSSYCYDQVPQTAELVNNRNVNIPHSFRGWKSKIKTPARPMSGEGSLLGLQMAPSLCVLM